jgi:hypothetical protein
VNCASSFAPFRALWTDSSLKRHVVFCDADVQSTSGFTTVRTVCHLLISFGGAPEDPKSRFASRLQLGSGTRISGRSAKHSGALSLARGLTWSEHHAASGRLSSVVLCGGKLPSGTRKTTPFGSYDWVILMLSKSRRKLPFFQCL